MNQHRPNTEPQTPPTAIATKLEPNPSYPGAHIVTVTCPYCNTTHSHGIPAEDRQAGHRLAHCHDPAARQINTAGYDIHLPDELQRQLTTDQPPRIPSGGDQHGTHRPPAK